MKKVSTLLSFILLMGFISCNLAEAQMINYKRRNGNQKVKAVKKGKAIQKKAKKNNNRYQNRPKMTAKAESMDPKVTNRVERLYDLNRDGALQKTEVNDFYKDVVSSVKNKGTFRVSTDLLKQFDANDDGKISRYEIKSIADQIN